MSAGGNFPPLHEVLLPKCLEPERLNSSNSGFPFSELAGWKVHDSGLSRTIGFYLSSLPHWHHFLLLPFLGGGDGIWPHEHSKSQGSCTESLFGCKGHTQGEVLGLPHATPGLHTPPAPAHTLSALYRKFATLWPRIKVPFWINTKAIKCAWVVGLKYQSCFIAGMQDLGWYRPIKSEGLRGILMRW